MDSPSAWTVQSNLTQTKARRKKIGSEKKLHQKMRRIKAQPMGTVRAKVQTPHDSPYLPDSATDESAFIVHSSVFTNRMNFAGHDLESRCVLLVLEL